MSSLSTYQTLLFVIEKLKANTPAVEILKENKVKLFIKEYERTKKRQEETERSMLEAKAREQERREKIKMKRALILATLSEEEKKACNLHIEE